MLAVLFPMVADSAGGRERMGATVVTLASPAGLVRRLGTGDAVVIGLGSMIGAGVFAAFGPAARAAGTGLLVGLVIAAVIAYCNASASAQLAGRTRLPAAPTSMDASGSETGGGSLPGGAS